MTPRALILATAQARFPSSANKNVLVYAAWHPERSTLSSPAPNGSDGWVSVGEPATFEVIRDLRDRGFTHVNLQSGGVANPFRDVPISELIGKL